MVDFNLLVRLINTNGDGKIQKQEMKDFLKSQDSKSPSIYTKYFKSIKSDVTIEQFKDGMTTATQKAYMKNNGSSNGVDTELHFIDEEIATKYDKIKQEIDLHDQFYSSMGYKFKSDEDFEMAFTEAMTKAKNSDDFEFTLWDSLEKATANFSQKDMMERINSGKFNYIGTDFQDIVFEDIDLSSYTEAFKHIPFNEKTFANVSPEHLPEGFNPKEILEKGRTIGLGIDEVHTQMNNGKGYTGEGVSFAIIDSGVPPHNSLNFKEYNVAESAKNIEWLNHFHGGAVSYIAQEIAPKADCYYYAQQNGMGMDKPVLENLKSILEKNKSLPENQRIRFVSMSMPLYGGEDAQQVVKELEDQGVWVYYSGCPEDQNRGYLEKIDPNGNPNDFNNYQIANGEGGMLYVNSGNRTVPDPSNPDAFRHDSNASQSWSIPVMAGYYTLACQADPTMTKEKFMELAEKTARVQQSSLPNWVSVGDGNNENDWVKQGRKDEVVDIKVIDIKALLEEIEDEKSQQAE